MVATRVPPMDFQTIWIFKVSAKTGIAHAADVFAEMKKESVEPGVPAHCFGMMTLPILRGRYTSRLPAVVRYDDDRNSLRTCLRLMTHNRQAHY